MNTRGLWWHYSRCRLWISWMMWLVALPVIAAVGSCEEPTVAKTAPPAQYLLDYPQATAFCPPVRTMFADAAKTVIVRRGKRFRTPPNSGFGYAMWKNPATGETTYHVGSDCGWFQPGLPVYAVANGVVRVSNPPLSIPGGVPDQSAIPVPSAWGNMIAIEHRLDDGKYVTTIYGHLDNNRLVQTGDVVNAGQMIGRIGPQDVRINGGYKPHLHFGVRSGRLAEPGRQLAKSVFNGQVRTLCIDSVSSESLTLALEDGSPLTFATILAGERSREINGKQTLPARVLWSLQSPDFALIGYSRNREGWLNPLEFLRSHRAHTKPATVQEFSHPPEELPIPQRDLIGKPALAFRRTPDGDAVPNVPQPAELKGQVACFVFLQASCTTSRTLGLPVLRELQNRYAQNPAVTFVAVNAALADAKRNTAERLSTALAEQRLSLPVGHLEWTGQKNLLSDYGIRATPWVLIIGPDGRVHFNNFCLDTATLASEIDPLCSGSP